MSAVMPLKDRKFNEHDEGGFDPRVCPMTYAELFENYYGFVCGLVRKLGIESQKMEDVASEILLRFYERDFLDKFDPDRVFMYDGQAHTARFQSFLGGFVASYVRHHRDRQTLMARRELLKCDNPIGLSGTPWIEIFGPSSTDDFVQFETDELVDSIAAYLAAVPRRSKRDHCDLPRLFELVVEQILATGKIIVADLRDEFGVSNTAIYNWLDYLREQVRLALEA
jgi:hypothetical protein